MRLNGKTILESDNMFLPQRVDITHAIGDEEEYELEIEFDSALLKARDIEKQHPEHKFVCFNGDAARLAVRKAQYHWGWDWGPLLMCVGVWRPIRIEVYSARISDIRTDLNLAKDYKSATVRVSAEVEGHEKHSLHARMTISLDGKTVSTANATVSAHGKVSEDLKVDQPSLWMPAGYGQQALYKVEVVISSEGEELHSESRRIGMREVELVQEPDSYGKSFYFRINGTDIFCGGSCWIPTDSFLTNVTPEKFRAWIELMVPANQKMLR